MSGTLLFWTNDEDRSMTRSQSQSTQILNHLKSGKPINPMLALRRFGCFRLGARIYDLKRQGHSIIREWETSKDKRWARYRMRVRKTTGNYL